MVSESPTAPLTPAAPTSNGHGPAMPRHESWLPVPEYDGYEILGWVNPPQRVLLDLDSGDSERVTAALRSLLLKARTVTPDQTYDAWFDADGEPLPQPGADDFLAVVPTELLAMALRAVRVEGPLALGNAYGARRISARRASG